MKRGLAVTPCLGPPLADAAAPTTGRHTSQAMSAWDQLRWAGHDAMAAARNTARRVFGARLILNHGPRIVLILRRKVSANRPGRLILNERATLEAISHADALSSLTTIELERLPLHKQWEAMSQADLAIGVHGAGLANALLMPECGVLIEIRERLRPGYTQFVPRGGTMYLAYTDAKIRDLSAYEFFHRNITINTTLMATYVKEGIRKWNWCRRSLG